VSTKYIKRIRVVVWSTGGIGSIAIRAVHQRHDMELVGVWVHTPEKVGQDAGELAGGEAIGIRATNDADALIALRPDCVVYAASGPQRDAAAVPDYVRFLQAGINVVSTTSTRLVFPRACDVIVQDQMSEAAKAGKASFYASGIFPGFASDQLPLLLSTQSMNIKTVRATEISLNDHYPVASVMMDAMGFGRKLDFEPTLSKPGYIEKTWSAPIYLIADALGAKVQEVRGCLDRELTHRPIEVAFGTIEAETCGAVRTRAIGIINGREAIIIDHIIRMARDVAPNWPSSEHDATYNVSIEGFPNIECSMTMGYGVGHDAGESAMAASAMRIVNAIPYVIDAKPGLLSSNELPITLPRYAL